MHRGWPVITRTAADVAPVPAPVRLSEQLPLLYDAPQRAKLRIKGSDFVV
jgi:hypothetical protein